MEITEKDVQPTETQVLDQIISNRRSLIKLGGAALAGFAFAGIAKAQTAVTDTDILNFALNLEYLEAEYYTIATSGMTIDQMGIGITGTGTQGGVTVKNNSPRAQKYHLPLPPSSRTPRRSQLKNASTSHSCATHWVHPQSRNQR